LLLTEGAERFGTLDYSLIKNRPNTTLDPLLKSTYWYTPGTGFVSLWRDGLLPHENVPIDGEGRPLCDPWEHNKRLLAGAASQEGAGGGSGSGGGGWGVGEVAERQSLIHRRRQALAPATVAVDMLKNKYRGMLHEGANVPPRINPSALVLTILQSAWLEEQSDEGDVTADAIYDWLLAKNAQLSEWPLHAWSSIGVAFDVVAKAREKGFFLGCSDRWKREADTSTVRTTVIDRDTVTPIGRISGPNDGQIRYWERLVAE
jgi:hypothetical protein